MYNDSGLARDLVHNVLGQMYQDKCIKTNVSRQMYQDKCLKTNV